MQNKKSFLFCIVFDLHYLCSRNILAVEVRPTYEFTQLILSFGKDVEVLKPEWLRRQIAEKLGEILKKYSSVQEDCNIE